MNPKTAKAIAELRKDAKPTLDEEAMEIVKADVKRFYGFDWPEGADLVDGAKALFAFLIEKNDRQN